MRQLALELGSAPAPTLDNFLVGDNAEALAALQAMIRGEERFIYLWGGSGSGRSHLLLAMRTALRAAGRTAHHFAGSAAGIGAGDAVCADDVQQLDAASQVALFNVFNTLREGDGLLLAAGDLPPARLALRPDLLTRLAWGLVYELRPLPEAACRSALRDYVAARGLGLPAEVADYLLARVPRDLRSLRALADTLDRASLEQKRPLTIPLVRGVLQALPRAGHGGTGENTDGNRNGSDAA